MRQRFQQQLHQLECSICIPNDWDTSLLYECNLAVDTWSGHSTLEVGVITFSSIIYLLIGSSNIMECQTIHFQSHCASFRTQHSSGRCPQEEISSHILSNNIPKRTLHNSWQWRQHTAMILTTSNVTVHFGKFSFLSDYRCRRLYRCRQCYQCLPAPVKPAASNVMLC